MKDPSQLIGSKVDRFEIRAVLGRGGMGEVFKAWDPVFNCDVALKRISPQLELDPGALLDFQSEADHAGAFRHHGVAMLFPPFTAAEGRFLVMEYVDGETLKDRLRREVRIEEFAAFATQCAEALHAAHSRGILHRDLKPQNIMLTRTGEVKICDFGLAISFRPGSGQDGGSRGFQGTARYAAPEVLAGGSPSPQSDIYSLGVVFREFLSRVFTAVPGDITVNVNATAHGAFGKMTRLTARMTDPNRETRMQTAAEVLDCLRASSASPLVQGPTGPRRLVIAPFESQGFSHDDKALATGLAEALNNQLRRLLAGTHHLVIPQSDVRAKGSPSLETARSDLGASHFVSGSVSRAQQSIICEIAVTDTMKLGDVEHFSASGATSDIFDLIDKLAKGLMSILGLAVGSRQTSPAVRVAGPGAFELFLRGQGYLQEFDRMESLERAVAVFINALSVDNEYAPAHAGLAEAYWRKYEISKEVKWTRLAKDAALRAISLDRDLAPAQACLGMVLNGSGEYEQSIQAYSHAIERDPLNEAYYAGLATAFERIGRSEEAERTYARAIAIQPNHWGGYNHLAKFLYARGRYTEAAGMYEQILALVPDSFWGYMGLGVCRFAMGEEMEGIDCLQKSLKLRETDIAASNLGSYHFYVNDFVEAEKAFRRATELNPNGYRNWSNLGATLRNLGKVEESRAAYDAARKLAQVHLDVNARNPEMLSMLAVCYGNLADKERSLDFLKRALIEGPSNGEVLFRAASIYCEDLGDRDEAMNYVKRALQAGFPLKQIATDPSLSPLHQRPDFRDLIGS